MNPDQSNQPRERSIPITTTQGNMTTTHFPVSSTSSHPATSSGPFSGSPGRGNLFNQLHHFRKNHHADEMFSDRSHFSPFMNSGSRNVGDFFSHGHRDEEEESEQESHQPRVYNIPIQVETPEGVVPLAKSNSHSPSSTQFRGNHSYHVAPSPGGGPVPERIGETFTRQRPGPSPTPPPKPRLSSSYKPESQGYTHQPYHPDARPQTHQHHRVHNIPVQIEKGFKPSESVSNQNVTGSDQRVFSDPNIGRDSPRPDSQQSGGGPHVINIPINNEKSQPSENKSQLPPQPQHVPYQSKATCEPQKGPVDPLDLIKGIKDEACRLESEVNKFDGESQKQYRYLDEMLTRCMLKLDDIESGGRDEVRSARKSTLAYVDSVIAILENKFNKTNATKDQNEVPDNKDESNMQPFSEKTSSMEAETAEADSTQQEESADHLKTETQESGDCESTGEVDNKMEVESGPGQSNETIADQPDERQDEDVADGEAIEEEEEEEDPSGVDGSKQPKRSSLKKWIKKSLQRSRPPK